MQARLQALGYVTERVTFDDGNRSLYIEDPDGNCLELMDAVVDWSGAPVRPGVPLSTSEPEIPGR